MLSGMCWALRLTMFMFIHIHMHLCYFMITTLEGWYYCCYTEEKAGFVRDFVTAQARVDIRIELRNGPRPVCFQISYSSSLCHATLPKDGDHPRISTSRCTSEGSKVPRGSGPASWTGSVYQCAVSLLQGTSLGAFFFSFWINFRDHSIQFLSSKCLAI